MVKSLKTKSRNNSRISQINRELLLFLLFLIVALAFWFILTLRNSTNATLEFDLNVSGVPNSVIVTSKIPEKVSVRLKGQGFQLMKLLLNGTNRKVIVDYSSLKDNNKALIINEDVWRKAFSKILPSGVSVYESSLPTIEIYYSNGEHKHIPVRVAGYLYADADYVIGDIKLQPEFVDIYAPKDSYDTINYVNTQSVELGNMKDTTEIELKLNPPVGVKCVPNKVKATICVDLQTTKQITIPIYTINIPQNVILKPFPMTATVTYQVSASKYDEIRDEQFNAVIDYSTIKPFDSQCNVVLSSLPEGVSNVKYSPHRVDYVIEQSED